jgi:hypothetical protein
VIISFIKQILNASLLIFYPKRRAVFRLALAPVIEARRRYVGVSQPVLNLGDIGFVRERVGRRRGAQRMHTEAGGLATDAGFQAVFKNDIAIDRWPDRDALSC